MRKFAFVLIVGLAFSVHAAKEEHISKVETIFKRYLDTPHPKGPSKTDAYDRRMDKKTNRARLDRLAILAELKAFPTESVLVARRVLFEQADPKQRHEIVGRLGEIHTRECAELLRDVIQNVRKPKDEDEALYEELVRSSAVQGLRTMGGRRTVRFGGKRIQQGADFEPKVPGLVPYMISAADDPAERVRISALYALADSREPAAVAELRNRLKDPSNKVRLYAACFLTEYQDAAGLTEMRKALDRLRKTDVGHDFDLYWNIEMLLASFERITGKSFGDIPLNPMLSGYSPPPGKKRYKELLDTWHTWWTWKPDG
jgi:HEAT repeat protein